MQHKCQHTHCNWRSVFIQQKVEFGITELIEKLAAKAIPAVAVLIQADFYGNKIQKKREFVSGGLDNLPNWVACILNVRF